MSVLSIDKPLVSVNWLKEHIDASNLVILDASILKVTENTTELSEEQIPNSRFFDLKKRFSDVSAEFPNTFPLKEQFTDEAQKLGINKDSAIVIYDDIGIYSSPRAWWLFMAFGHNNVAVLDGGLPEWKKAGFVLETKQEHNTVKGNFIANQQKEKMYFFKDMQNISKERTMHILDARSENRFKCLSPEPRKGLRSGTIPNSENLPFTSILEGGKMKSSEQLKAIFNKFGTKDDHYVFSCGSGITACVLALGAWLSGRKNLTVYDGSWTEYGSLTL